jgi:hypothetical protein
MWRKSLTAPCNNCNQKFEPVYYQQCQHIYSTERQIPEWYIEKTFASVHQVYYDRGEKRDRLGKVQMEPVLGSLYYRISVKKITQPIASLNTAKQQLINTKSSIKPTSPIYYTL